MLAAYCEILKKPCDEECSRLWIAASAVSIVLAASSEEDEKPCEILRKAWYKVHQCETLIPRLPADIKNQLPRDLFLGMRAFVKESMRGEDKMPKCTLTLGKGCKKIELFLKWATIFESGRGFHIPTTARGASEIVKKVLTKTLSIDSKNWDGFMAEWLARAEKKRAQLERHILSGCSARVTPGSVKAKYSGTATKPQIDLIFASLRDMRSPGQPPACFWYKNFEALRLKKTVLEYQASNLGMFIVWRVGGNTNKFVDGCLKIATK